MNGQRVLLKDQLFNTDKVVKIAAELSRSHPKFDAHTFERQVMSRLPDLELKQRIAWLTDCLTANLPDDYRRAVNMLLASLPAPCDPALSDGDFGDFSYAAYAQFVARHGCTPEDLDFSLATLRALTTRFSAEDAIRSFINTFPNETLMTLMEWTADEHYHVRRLCSEGTRPKLPWSRKLTTPLAYGIPLLDRLYRDRTRFVTRSVANHVNDISKLDPDLAVDTLRRWSDSCDQEVGEIGYVVRHATRSLVRQGNPRAMELLGVPTRPAVTVSNFHVPQQVQLGSALEFSFTITALADTEVIADYVLHYQGKGGRITGRKVYKLRRVRLAKGDRIALSKRHLLRANMTTREIRPGRHELEIQLNGLSQRRCSFSVTP